MWWVRRIFRLPEIKQQFYNLACSYSVNVNADNLNISLSGLSEHMPAALKLLENLLQNAQATQESYNSFVDVILKARENRKQDQRTCFDYLYHYALYGPHNIRRVTSGTWSTRCSTTDR